jgi:Holliday junction resolvase
MMFFLLILVLIGGYSSYNHSFKTVEAIALTNKERNINLNPAENIQLKGSGSYKVDNKNFKPGFYDIKSLKGNVRIGNVLLSEGDQYLGKQYFSNNSVSVKGNGLLQLTPAKFKKEALVNGTYTISNKSVIYQAGVEIESGLYTIQVNNNLKTPFYVFVDINDDDGNSVQTFDIKKSNTYTFSIKQGEVLEILNWSEDDTDLIVKLTQVKE